MNFSEASEFQKDIKALRKRVPTILSDLQRVRPKLEALYTKRDGITEPQLREFREQFFSGKKAARIEGSTEAIDVIKMRLDTDTDQYRTKLRLVCIVIRQGEELTFVELYSKSDKVHIDTKRVKRYL